MTRHIDRQREALLKRRDEILGTVHDSDDYTQQDREHAELDEIEAALDDEIERQQIARANLDEQFDC